MQSNRFHSTIFNRLFEEIISLKSYVNEQLENVKKSHYDSQQSAKCDHSTGTDELQHLREENRSKKEIIKLFSENISSGNNVMKEVSPLVFLLGLSFLLQCDHSTGTDELQHLREENRSKKEIIKLFSENISSGNNVMKEVFPHKENTFIGFGKKYSFKAKKRFGNQKTGTNLVLQ